MSFWSCVGIAAGVLFLIYTAARLITAAYFRSKADYEKRGDYGTK